KPGGLRVSRPPRNTSTVPPDGSSPEQPGAVLTALGQPCSIPIGSSHAMGGKTRTVTISRLIRRLGALALGAGPLAPPPPHAQGEPAWLRKIETIVVIYLENRSFDHAFGNFPGANGLANAGAAAVQVDEAGRPYEGLPDPLDLRQRPPVRYAALPEKLPN